MLLLCWQQLMTTPAHLIFNLALYDRQQIPHSFSAVLWGALVPDLPIMLMFAWEKLVMAKPLDIIRYEIYVSDPWRAIIDTPNSIPFILIGLLAVLAFQSTWFKLRPKLGLTLPQVEWVKLFFISMLGHVVLDLPVHIEDAHRHLFPFSNYKFISSFSYWNNDHHAQLILLIEIVLLIVASHILWHRRPSRPGHRLLLAVISLYVAVFCVRYVLI